MEVFYAWIRDRLYYLENGHFHFVFFSQILSLCITLESHFLDLLYDFKAHIRPSPQKRGNLVHVYQTCLFLLLGATFCLQPSQRLSFGKRHSLCQALWGGQDAPLMLPCCCALMMPSRAATWLDAPILPALPENSRLLGFSCAKS